MFRNTIDFCDCFFLLYTSFVFSFLLVFCGKCGNIKINSCHTIFFFFLAYIAFHAKSYIGGIGQLHGNHNYSRLHYTALKMSTTKPAKKVGKGPSQEKIIADFNQLRQDHRSLMSKVAELEGDVNEHRYLILTKQLPCSA